MISNYDFAVNAIGQPTGIATSGTAFPPHPSWLWTDDALGPLPTENSTLLWDAENRFTEYTKRVGVPPTLQKTRFLGTDLSGILQSAD